MLNKNTALQMHMLFNPRSYILISACLLGEKVRFDGKTKKVESLILERWQADKQLLSLCPEVAGGLTVPRPAAEIQDGDVINILGENISLNFHRGAQEALRLCKKHQIRMAILKEGSPSCGVNRINDGSFTRTKIIGQGITSTLLQKHGVQVFSEQQLNEAAAYFYVTLQQQAYRQD
ncbi:MAG: DUF523 domain-containing protein [Mariprofundaceae bacterium]|nr:DUF523 domain-containing protein [Mariprofundaceae bacterium]